jgi:hypothetical protein
MDVLRGVEKKKGIVDMREGFHERHPGMMFESSRFLSLALAKSKRLVEQCWKNITRLYNLILDVKIRNL